MKKSDCIKRNCNLLLSSDTFSWDIVVRHWPVRQFTRHIDMKNTHFERTTCLFLIAHVLSRETTNIYSNDLFTKDVVVWLDLAMFWHRFGNYNNLYSSHCSMIQSRKSVLNIWACSFFTTGN